MVIKMVAIIRLFIISTLMLLGFMFGRFSKENRVYGEMIDEEPIQLTADSTEILTKGMQESIEMVMAINLARKEKNLSTLTMEDSLLCAAQIRVVKLGKINECMNEDKGVFVTRVRNCGYARFIGAQIVGCNVIGAREMIERWVRTQSDIVYGNYSKIGCDEYNGFWVCIFAK